MQFCSNTVMHNARTSTRDEAANIAHGLIKYMGAGQINISKFLYFHPIPWHVQESYLYNLALPTTALNGS